MAWRESLHTVWLHTSAHVLDGHPVVQVVDLWVIVICHLVMGKGQREGRQPVIGVLSCHLSTVSGCNSMRKHEVTCETYATEWCHQGRRDWGIYDPSLESHWLRTTPRDVLGRQSEAAGPSCSEKWGLQKWANHWHTPFSTAPTAAGTPLFVKSPAWMTSHCPSVMSTDRPAYPQKTPTVLLAVVSEICGISH